MSQPRPIPSPTRSALSRLSAVLATAAAATALVACGSSKSPTGVAAGERADERQNEAKLAEFAKCMREHGVEAKTSSGAGGQGLEIGAKGSTGRQTLERAQRACKQYQPQPKKVNVSPQEQVAQEEAVLKFARCMREHGVIVHASASSGNVQINVGGAGASGSPNPESPSFQAAQKACQSLLPFKGKGGPDAGPSTSPGTGGQAAGPAGGASLHIRG